MTGNDAARIVNGKMPGNDLRYDGTQEDVDGTTAHYQFTPMAGIAKSASFAVKTCDPEAVTAALEVMIEKFRIRKGEIR